MSKKKKRSDVRSLLKRLLLKYGCFSLFLPAWLIAPPKYDPPVTSFLICLCYIYLETFSWLDDTKSDSKEKRIKLLARFWRYGYFAIQLSLSLLCRSRLSYSILFFGGSILYSAYTIVIALSMSRHFICGMQDASHQPMNPYQRKIPYSSYRRDGLLMGIIFLLLGIFGLTVT